jgi:hypothetical protein
MCRSHDPYFVIITAYCSDVVWRMSTLIMSANSVKGSRGSFNVKSSKATKYPACCGRFSAATTRSSTGTDSSTSTTASVDGKRVTWCLSRVSRVQFTKPRRESREVRVPFAATYPACAAKPYRHRFRENDFRFRREKATRNRRLFHQL